MSGGSYDYKYYTIEEYYVGAMYDAELDEMMEDLVEVLHDVEWWQSGDICEDGYRKTVKKFKDKWFNTDRGERIMTREEAIKALKNPPRVYDEDMWTALDMAIEALSGYAILHESCEDCPLYDHERHNCPRFNKVIPRTIADAKTDGDMGEVSDGYHTFNQLYHQRAVLFATIVKQNKEKAWKSWKHEDGNFCFDSNKEWFIVGVDTPEGSYTYHYEKKYWDMFDCVELEHGKLWDGHTEEDVTRLLSLPSADAVQGGDSE